MNVLMCYVFKVNMNLNVVSDNRSASNSIPVAHLI